MMKQILAIVVVVITFLNYPAVHSLNSVLHEKSQSVQCKHQLLNGIHSGSWKSTNENIYEEIVDKHEKLSEYISNTATSEHFLEKYHGDLIRMQIHAAQNPCVKIICEIGFGGGHSAITWLAANPYAQIIFFDLYSEEYGPVGIQYVDTLVHLIPSRILLNVGDASHTTRKYHFLDTSKKCDLLSINGNISYYSATSYLRNMFFLANPEFNILMADTTPCQSGECAREAFRATIRQRQVKIYDQVQDDIGNQLSIATYLRETVKKPTYTMSVFGD